MKYYFDTTDFHLDGPSAVTLGKFDGLHLGHRKLLNNIRAYSADHADTRSVVFALNSHRAELLLTAQEQRIIAQETGVDVLINCPFVPDISGMTPLEFVENVLVKRMHAVYVAVGTDFRFGYKRSGDVAFLCECGKKYGFYTQVIEKETYRGREISSTYIREALRVGDMELVTALMGREYPVTGRVVHGAHIGSTIGFPTANLITSSEKMLPPDGVYFTKNMLNGEIVCGVTNIGYKPTVDGTFRGVETYMLDRGEDLYGKEIITGLAHFSRPETKFASLSELKDQIACDIKNGREYFREQGVMVR